MNMPNQPVSGGSPSFAAPEKASLPALPAQKVKEPYHATLADAWFALCCIGLGYLWMRWVVVPLPQGSLAGWGQGLFTLLFAAGVLWYARAKAVKPCAESWFWLAVLLCLGLSACLWPGAIMAPMRLVLWPLAALWWCGSLFGCLLAGKTGNWAALDGLNLLLLIPLKNLLLLPRSLCLFLGEGRRENSEETTENKTAENTEKTGKKMAENRKNILAVLLGLALCLPLLLLVLPLLTAADSGGFTQLGQALMDWLSRVFKDPVDVYLWQFVLGLPVAVYLFGLVGGGAHRRYVGSIDVKKAERDKELARLVPELSVLLVLGVVCLLYGLFIGCQLPHYFSAFAGRLPKGVEVYSEYAREGFFELCRVAAINLLLCAGAASLCRGRMAQSRPLRVFTLVLDGLTILLVLTAMSKMLLYIGSYGLTVKRVQTTVFMVFLLLLCGGVAVAVFRKISVLRFGMMAGSVLVCLLCLVNLDSLAMQYNAARYTAGSLVSIEGFGLWSEGDAGSAKAVLAMYEAAGEEDKERLGWDLENTYRQTEALRGSPAATLSGGWLLQNTALSELVAQRQEARQRAETARDRWNGYEAAQYWEYGKVQELPSYWVRQGMEKHSYRYYSYK